MNNKYDKRVYAGYYKRYDEKLRAQNKRQTQMRIERDFIEVLEMDNLPSPKRKSIPRPDEGKYREYRTATNYYDYSPYHLELKITLTNY